MGKGGYANRGTREVSQAKTNQAFFADLSNRPSDHKHKWFAKRKGRNTRPERERKKQVSERGSLPPNLDNSTRAATGGGQRKPQSISKKNNKGGGGGKGKRKDMKGGGGGPHSPCASTSVRQRKKGKGVQADQRLNVFGGGGSPDPV